MSRACLWLFSSCSAQLVLLCVVCPPRLPRSVEQRVLRPDELAHVHGHVAELVAQQAAETHEGGRVPDEPLRVRHHFAPVRRPGAGQQALRPRCRTGRSPAAQSAPRSGKHLLSD